jgi:hypothetical protein
MDITLTFYKKIGATAPDDFLGTFSGPDSGLSQWEILQRDAELKELKIKFTLVEFESIEKLPTYVAQHFKTAGLTDYGLVIRYQDGSTTSAIYPKRSALKVANIKSWALEFARKTVPAAIANNKPVVAPVVGTAPSTTTVAAPQSTATLEPTKQSTSWVPYILGTSILMAGFAAVGAIGGSVLADKQLRQKEDEEGQLYLIDEYGSIQRDWQGEDDFNPESDSEKKNEEPTL